MAKTQEELNQLKTEYETLTTKLQELSEDELNIVTGGNEYAPNIIIDHGTNYEGGKAPTMEESVPFLPPQKDK